MVDMQLGIKWFVVISDDYQCQNGYDWNDDWCGSGDGQQVQGMFDKMCIKGLYIDWFCNDVLCLLKQGIDRI